LRLSGTEEATSIYVVFQDAWIMVERQKKCARIWWWLYRSFNIGKGQLEPNIKRKVFTWGALVSINVFLMNGTIK